MKYDKEYCGKASEYLKTKVPCEPEIGIVLGSGLGPLSNAIKNPIEIPYGSIPNFLVSTVSSHAGKMIFGEISGKHVMCMSGRFHYYEGYDFEQLVMPVRVMQLMGVKTLILTNAAGGVNPIYKPGDIMVIKDQIKLNGASPLRGKNIEEFGPRFFDVSDMYTKSLRKLALSLSKDTELSFHEGVYFYMPGPQFETPAEIHAIHVMGGDAVGMSTVTEALTAAHCSMKLLGFSVISNMAAGVKNEVLTTNEVDDITEKISEPFSKYMTNVIENL
ncbi:MAG: purine-nucleoside phosphorylase [Solobacterium sp.]|jgi:purine-nucleoside phosphorylase|nr:purine-nucleoside phosphorylase [Solobacterium sp.]